VQRQTNVPNDSEVVALDPTTGRFCTYLVPGANTQVAGVAVTGASPHINVWFVASYGSSGEGSLDEFNPSTIGRGCNGRTNKYFTLPKSVKRLSWPNSGAQWPEQIAVDRSAQTLWISDFNPYVAHRTIYSGIDRVDIADPTHPTFVQRYLYPTVNISSIFGCSTKLQLCLCGRQRRRRDRPDQQDDEPDTGIPRSVDNRPRECLRIGHLIGTALLHAGRRL
jgi:hypothetical protein